jgi:receptor-type tyrosine-protein phosphatase beta
LSRFELPDSGIKAIEKAAQDPERKVTFSDLTPGRLYNVTMWTVSGGVTSAPLVAQERTHPGAVATVEAVDVRATRITLSWAAPEGDWDSFEVEYLDHGGRLLREATPQPSVTISNLKPFR